MLEIWVIVFHQILISCYILLLPLLLCDEVCLGIFSNKLKIAQWKMVSFICIFALMRLKVNLLIFVQRAMNSLTISEWSLVVVVLSCCSYDLKLYRLGLCHKYITIQWNSFFACPILRGLGSERRVMMQCPWSRSIRGFVQGPNGGSLAVLGLEPWSSEQQPMPLTTRGAITTPIFISYACKSAQG